MDRMWKEESKGSSEGEDARAGTELERDRDGGRREGENAGLALPALCLGRGDFDLRVPASSWSERVT